MRIKGERVERTDTSAVYLVPGIGPLLAMADAATGGPDEYEWILETDEGEIRGSGATPEEARAKAYAELRRRLR